MPAIHQFAATFEPSATGNHTLQVQKALREAGFESEIFAEFVKPVFGNPAFNNLAHTLGDYGRKVPARPGDVLMYQLAIGSNVADYVRNRRETLVVNYHNISPIDLWEAWEPGVAYGLAWGRQQLAELAPRTATGIAVSTYNRAELDAVGYRSTSVAPVLLDLASFDHGVDAALLHRLQAAKADGGGDWLFVGSLAPHKCQHDIVKAFSIYRKLYDPKARLHLVGGVGSVSYNQALERLTYALQLEQAVFRHGTVTDDALRAHYKAADVFVCLSEHEGFCLPVVEAMYNRVPVVAFAQAAVPETVGNAGLLLANKSAGTVATAVDRVMSDGALAEELRRRGEARLANFGLERARKCLLESLAVVTG